MLTIVGQWFSGDQVSIERLFADGTHVRLQVWPHFWCAGPAFFGVKGPCAEVTVTRDRGAAAAEASQPRQRRDQRRRREVNVDRIVIECLGHRRIGGLGRLVTAASVVVRGTARAQAEVPDWIEDGALTLDAAGFRAFVNHAGEERVLQGHWGEADVLPVGFRSVGESLAAPYGPRPGNDAFAVFLESAAR